MAEFFMKLYEDSSSSWGEFSSKWFFYWDGKTVDLEDIIWW